MMKLRLILLFGLGMPTVALAYGGATRCRDLTDPGPAGYQATFEHNEGCRNSFDITKLFVYDPSGPAEELDCQLMGGSASCGKNPADFTQDSNGSGPSRTLLVHYKTSWAPQVHDIECVF